MGKRIPGGLSAGLLIREYMDMFPLKSAENVPTAMGIRIAIIKVLLSFIFIDITKHVFCFVLGLRYERYDLKILPNFINLG